MSGVWFSAMLRFVILVEDEGATRRDRSVVVFRANDWSRARQRALEQGRVMERSFVGGTGHEVLWRLEAVETVDMLGTSIDDGRAVYSESVDLKAGEVIPFETEFRPQESQPGQTGV
jgi:hypothetical protein